MIWLWVGGSVMGGLLFATIFLFVRLAHAYRSLKKLRSQFIWSEERRVDYQGRLEKRKSEIILLKREVEKYRDMPYYIEEIP